MEIEIMIHFQDVVESMKNALRLMELIRAGYFPGNFNFPGTGILENFPGFPGKFPGNVEKKN
mgnify:CR=1 FL=1